MGAASLATNQEGKRVRLICFRPCAAQNDTGAAVLAVRGSGNAPLFSWPKRVCLMLLHSLLLHIFKIG